MEKKDIISLSNQELLDKLLETLESKADFNALLTDRALWNDKNYEAWTKEHLYLTDLSLQLQDEILERMN